ncbi:hypothetical protein ACFL6X_01345 [Candidatus Latescibacterota bacterium]
MSGYTHNGFVHQQDLAEYPAFIAKPFTPENFTLKVREVLDA